jgi:hypothetical protein
MTARRAVASAALLTVLAVLGAACGDSDDSASGGSDQRQDYVDALAASAEESGDGLSAEERSCVAESFVDGYGPEQLDEAGVSPDDLREADGPGELALDFSDEQKDAFYGQLTDCMDVRTLMLDALSEDADAAEQVRACLDDNLDDDLIQRFLVTGFTEGDAGFADDPDLEGQLNAVFALCMPATGTDGTGAGG